MADDNPFADPEGINPFADPSVTAATSAQPGTGQDDYNPFADEGPPEKQPEPVRPPPPTKTEKKTKEKKKSKERPPAPTRPQESEPAIMQPDQDLPPAYAPAPNNFQDDELKKREDEIARREAALSERERNIERLGVGERPNNFPPFPKFCPAPFKPCFYINIKVEVPPSEQWKVYLLLALLIYTWLLLIINVVVCIIGAIIDQEKLVTMGVSILYIVLFAPASLFCWFLPTYYAYKRDSSLAFMWIFFVLFFQALSFILNAIGIPNLGAAGYFNGAQFFQKDRSDQKNAAGAMFVIMGFLWLVAVPIIVVAIIMIHRYYRSSGHTINSAMEEGVSGAARNQYVRGAVKSGVRAGVSTAFDNK